MRESENIFLVSVTLYFFIRDNLRHQYGLKTTNGYRATYTPQTNGCFNLYLIQEQLSVVRLYNQTIADTLPANAVIWKNLQTTLKLIAVESYIIVVWGSLRFLGIK